MFVGEAPGRDEVMCGRPFIGRSSTEFNRYLDGHMLPNRDEVFITGLVRQLPEGKGISDEEIRRDEPELWAEICEVHPDVIVALGRTAARYFLGDVDLETVHGIPHQPLHEGFGVLNSAQPLIYPAYHPAAGVHAPELAALFPPKAGCTSRGRCR
jgi:DNA polymerase